MTTSLTFEDRLLAELRQVVAANPAPPASRRRVAVPQRLLLVAAGAASAALAALIVAGGGGSSAYALERQSDGSVTVHINSLSDASGLEGSLRRAGIPAVVDYTPNCVPATAVPPKDGGPSFTTGQADTGGPHGAGARVKVTSSVRIDSREGVTFSLDPGRIPPGEKVFITTSTGHADAIGIEIAQKAPPAGCPAAP